MPARVCPRGSSILEPGGVPVRHSPVSPHGLPVGHVQQYLTLWGKGAVRFCLTGVCRGRRAGEPGFYQRDCPVLVESLAQVPVLPSAWSECKTLIKLITMLLFMQCSNWR